MVLLDRGNIAVVSTQVISNILLYGDHFIAISTPPPLPLKMVSVSSANKPATGTQNSQDITIANNNKQHFLELKIYFVDFDILF